MRESKINCCLPTGFEAFCPRVGSQDPSVEPPLLSNIPARRKDKEDIVDSDGDRDALPTFSAADSCVEKGENCRQVDRTLFAAFEAASPTVLPRAGRLSCRALMVGSNAFDNGSLCEVPGRETELPALISLGSEFRKSLATAPA